MIIKIDCREAELIQSCKYILEISPLYKNITIVVENLPIGDIILSENEIDRVVIERKSLRDLAASIKDGRYEEQSYRLIGLPMHNHNIIYLIEGDMNKFNVFKDRMEKLTLYSAMVSLGLYKGFSLMRSSSMEESALLICNMAYKISKNDLDGKTFYYKNQTMESQEQTTETQEQTAENYCTVVKKVKKDNITQDNIGEIMLSQIPGVSSTIAMTIMSHFKNMANLVLKIKEDQTCLTNFSYTNSKGQVRKINKTALSNIVKYLHTNSVNPE